MGRIDSQNGEIKKLHPSKEGRRIPRYHPDSFTITDKSSLQRTNIRVSYNVEKS